MINRAKEIWLNKEDLKKMLDVLEKHPEFDANFKLIYRSCAIGRIVDMEFRYKDVFEQVNITNEDEW